MSARRDVNIRLQADRVGASVLRQPARAATNTRPGRPRRNPLRPETRTTRGEGDLMNQAIDKPVVSMRAVSKAFSGVRVLNNVQFDLMPGEVHALVGENGAGKSTLMKILAGIYTKDTGEILLRGQPVDIRTPRSAQEHGISIIHQELNLMPHLGAAQNIFIGREPKRFGFLVNDEQLN